MASVLATADPRSPYTPASESEKEKEALLYASRWRGCHNLKKGNFHAVLCPSNQGGTGGRIMSTTTTTTQKLTVSAVNVMPMILN